ncbi:ParB N-terminal domain-containing protein [Actinoplanes sp. NPDC000266]
MAALRAADSPRSNADEEHVRLLSEVGAELPPILVHRDSMRVIDGTHRLRAAVAAGRSSVQVQFVDCSPEDAFVLAVIANSAHGLPLSRPDRRSAAVRIIGSFPAYADRAIAAVTGLSASTVARIRRETAAGEAPVRIGRDGRVRPLSAAAGRRTAGDELARRPDASLRDIARVAGVSVATARDVRERIRRGEDPVPAGRPAALAPPPGAGGSDPRPLLQNLKNDPALRMNENGREVLRWLFSHATGPQGWEDVLKNSPVHCRYVIAEVARRCADEWQHFATEIEHLLR